MALEDEMMEEEEVEQEDSRESLTDDEEADLSIFVTLAKNLIDDGGIEVIDKAEASSDPGQIIGQFLMQMVSQMGEALKGMGVDPSPRIFFAEGGWIEQISDYLQDEYDIPKDVMDRAEIYIGTTAQSIAQGQQAGGQQAPVPPGPEAAAPAMPQPGVM